MTATLKQMFGLQGTDLSEMDIMARIKNAYDNNRVVVEFTNTEGEPIVVRLPKIDFAPYMDPWDDWRSILNQTA